ncbi:MAG: BrnA antitoxin family protein [Methylotenera sp.]
MNKKLIRPTAAEDAAITAAAMSDPNAIPFTDSEWNQAKTQLKRGAGRPVGSTKAQVTLRLDLEVLQALKSTGRGWQTRANEVLRDWAHHQS